MLPLRHVSPDAFFFKHLACDRALGGSTTAGDCKSRSTGSPLVRVLFPDVATFRPHLTVNRLVSCIDSFVVPKCLADNVRVSGLEAVPCAQHRPILLELSQKFKSYDIIECSRPPAMDLGSWAPGVLRSVRPLDATIQTKLGGAGQTLLASPLPLLNRGV